MRQKNLIDSKPVLPLKEAIRYAFLVTGNKNLSFGDLVFLLLSKDIKRYPTKEKKSLYEKWEKQFSHPLYRKKNTNKNTERSWKPPFRQYKCSTQYFSRLLRKLVEEGKIQQVERGIYGPTRDKADLESLIDIGIKISSSSDFISINRGKQIDLDILEGFPPWFHKTLVPWDNEEDNPWVYRRIKHILYGFSRKDLAALAKDDPIRKSLMKCTMDIEVIIQKLEYLQVRLYEKKRKLVYGKLRQILREQKVKCRDPHVFFSLMVHFVQTYQDILHGNALACRAYGTDAKKWVLSEARSWADQHGLSHDQMLSILNWGWENHEVFSDWPPQIDVDFFRYREYDYPGDDEFFSKK